MVGDGRSDEDKEEDEEEQEEQKHPEQYKAEQEERETEGEETEEYRRWEAYRRLLLGDGFEDVSGERGPTSMGKGASEVRVARMSPAKVA